MTDTGPSGEPRMNAGDDATSVRARRSRRVRRMLPVGVAALGLVAGLLLAAYLVSRPSSPTGQASPTPMASASPPASASAAPTTGSSSEPEAPSVSPTASLMPSASAVPAGAARLAWAAGDAQGGRVSRITRFGGRWVAGGALVVGPTERAAVWTSTDGIAWSEPIILAPEPVDRDGLWTRYWINGFGEWNGLLLAFGWNGIGGGDGGYAMLWESLDGDTWEVVDITGTTFGDAYHVPQFSVEAPGGELAVYSGTGLGSGAATFLTSDLQTWETHAIAGPDPGAHPSVIAASPSRLLAVGTEQPPYDVSEDPPPGVPYAWTSTDARSWIPIDPPADAASLADLTWEPRHGQFIAVGNDANGLPFAWLTTDGASWVAVPLGDERAHMHRVTATDGLVVATGELGLGFQPQPSDTIVWSSHDATNWWYATVLEKRGGSAEAVFQGTAVLVTHRWTETDGDSWLSLAGTVTSGE